MQSPIGGHSSGNNCLFLQEWTVHYYKYWTVHSYKNGQLFPREWRQNKRSHGWLHRSEYNTKMKVLKRQWSDVIGMF